MITFKPIPRLPAGAAPGSKGLPRAGPGGAPARSGVQRLTHLAGFILFILLNATLFIRPAEIIPSLEDVQIYEALIIACLVVSLPAVLEQLRADSLTAAPITVCVLGMLAAVVLSHLSDFSIYGARTSGW